MTADQAAKIALLRAEIQAKLDVMKTDVVTTELELKSAQDLLAMHNKRTVQIDKTIESEKRKLAVMADTSSSTQRGTIHKKINSL